MVVRLRFTRLNNTKKKTLTTTAKGPCHAKSRPPPGEAIIIDHDIKITTLNIKGDYLSIRIDAPQDIFILREELDINKTKE